MFQHMLNNLRGLAVAQKDYFLALKYSGHHLLLVKQDYALRLVGADVWNKLGAPSTAEAEFRAALV